MKNYFDTMKYFVEKHVREWKATQGPLTMLPLLRALAYALLHQLQREQNNPSENQQKETVVSMLLQVAAEMKACGEEGGEDVVLDEDTIINNLLVFLLAGHETVLSTLCSLMKVLPQHPEVVRKAQGSAAAHHSGASHHPHRGHHHGQLSRRSSPSFHQSSRKVFDPDQFDREAEAYSSRYKDDDQSCFFSFASGIRCIGMKFAIMEVVTLLAVLMREKVVWELVPGQDLSMVRGGLSLKYKSGVVVNML